VDSPAIHAHSAPPSAFIILQDRNVAIIQPWFVFLAPFAYVFTMIGVTEALRK
jgi:hypothetical protein